MEEDVGNEKYDKDGYLEDKTVKVNELFWYAEYQGINIKGRPQHDYDPSLPGDYNEKETVNTTIRKSIKQLKFEKTYRYKLYTVMSKLYLYSVKLPLYFIYDKIRLFIKYHSIFKPVRWLIRYFRRV